MVRSIAFLSVFAATAQLSQANYGVLLSEFGPYPKSVIARGLNATADYKPMGEVELYFRDTSVVFDYKLTGVDMTCTEPEVGTANSCGIHIHSGMTCMDATKVGGHYYNQAKLEADPWTTAATYTVRAMTDGSMVAAGETTVDFGYAYDTTLGRAFVLHDKQGVRISCTIIYPNPQVHISGFGMYPGYTGPLKPSGIASLSMIDNSVKITYTLKNADPKCTTPSAQPNSCGIHIHVGKTCSDASMVGGHYFDDTTITEDPWAMATYMTDDKGVGEGNLMVTYGFDQTSTMGRAFVMHDVDGTRITCDMIK